jgi:energy-coupling factor transport system permease protein
MSDFELLASVTIGQYLPGRSPLHRLHPGVKLSVAAVLLLGLVVTDSLVALTFSVLLLLWLTALALVPPGFALRGVASAGPLILFVALLQVVAVPRNDTGTVLAALGPVALTTGDLHAAGLVVLRFAALIVLVSLMTFATSTRELVHGTEALLAPLSRIGLPGHEMALTLTVALRFLPILAIEAEHIAKAQASRGADFGSRSGRGRPRGLRAIRLLLPLLVPLFLAALRRAEVLATAMEARAYAGGRGRTRLVRYPLRIADAAAACVALVWTVLLIVSIGFDHKLVMGGIG